MCFTVVAIVLEKCVHSVFHMLYCSYNIAGSFRNIEHRNEQFCSSG